MFEINGLESRKGADKGEVGCSSQPRPTIGTPQVSAILLKPTCTPFLRLARVWRETPPQYTDAQLILGTLYSDNVTVTPTNDELKRLGLSAL